MDPPRIRAKLPPMPDSLRVALFCSDLDGTLLGLPDASLEFRRRWEALGGDRPVLVYSSGRLVDDARRVVRAAGLPDPDFYTGGVGTMIHDERENRAVEDFAEVLDDGWDRARVAELVRTFPQVEEQPPAQQHAWKSSWFWEAASEAELAHLREALREAGVAAQLVYSSARDLDLLPLAANKGNALRWLCEKLHLPLAQTIVAGDTGNDASMFLVPGVRAIAPANAAPELLKAAAATGPYHARAECAAGVIEGLVHHRLFPPAT